MVHGFEVRQSTEDPEDYSKYAEFTAEYAMVKTRDKRRDPELTSLRSVSGPEDPGVSSSLHIELKISILTDPDSLGNRTSLCE